MENNLLHRRIGLIVIKIDRAAIEQIALLSAELVRRGPLTVLDGNNCFPFYRIARLLRANADERAHAIRHLYVHRAFTCYQMLALLESTPAGCQHVLDACLGQIKRLCMHLLP